MADVRVLLCTLSIRQSKAGKSYVTGWLGKSKLVGWSGMPDKFGNRTIDLYLTPQEERREPRRELATTIDGELAPPSIDDWSDR
jgi:hypothetical protein